MKNYTASEETKQKIREARKNQKNLNLTSAKGKHWYNNGILSIMCFEKDVPEGFLPGRIVAKPSDEAKKKMSISQKKALG